MNCELVFTFDHAAAAQAAKVNPLLAMARVREAGPATPAGAVGAA